MKIYLAPMEGIVDFIMRDVFTVIGGYDYCVTEFLRVTNTLYPPHVFFKICPELKNNAKTKTGIPVFLQLLGSDPSCIGENAARAVELGATNIDLNFGCPAKTVNKHDGGATLLKNPKRIYNVVSGVRSIVPKRIPVSAKIRLGYDDKEYAVENGIAAEEAGASLLIVHARTKKEGYRPPAYWEWIAKIREKLTIPVVANGEIWNVSDYIRCREISGCEDVMIGRGAISMPDLALQIKLYLSGNNVSVLGWQQVVPFIISMYTACWHHDDRGKYAICRLKQWLKMLMRNYQEAETLFQEIKVLTDPHVVYSKLNWMCSQNQGEFDGKDGVGKTP